MTSNLQHLTSLQDLEAGALWEGLVAETRQHRLHILTRHRQGLLPDQVDRVVTRLLVLLRAHICGPVPTMNNRLVQPKCQLLQTQLQTRPASIQIA